MRDGTGFIQAIVSKAAVGDEKFKQADHLSQETALIVHGTVRADSRAPGGYELDVSDFEIVSPSIDYPITPKEHGVDYLLDRRHLWIRSEKQAAILRVRHEVVSAVRDFFNDQGFILADTPIFTPAACEGTTTLFPVDYFEDQKVFLTQSGQLYAEANAMALGRVYNFGPVFRAEKSKTRRHLTEFWMVEPEMAYATLDDVIDLAEGLVVAVVSRVLEKRQRELKALERDTSKLETRARRRSRASRTTKRSKILHDKGQPFEWGGDLGGTDETILSQHFDRPVAIHRYPASVKPFYMEPDPAAARARAVRRHARARGHRRDHRRQPAPRELRRAAAAHQGSQPAAGSVRVVSRPAPLRIGPARRLRHGHRARRRMDLRPRARARSHAVPANDVQRNTVMKIGFVSLGCPKNLVDSEVMMGLSQEGGHTLTPNPADADVLVVNTCAFIDSAKEESVNTILELAEFKKTGNCKRLVVTGCLGERYRDELKAQIPEIDAVLGTGEVPEIVGAIEGATRSRTIPLTLVPVPIPNP